MNKDQMLVQLNELHDKVNEAYALAGSIRDSASDQDELSNKVKMATNNVRNLLNSVRENNRYLNQLLQ